jgi:hypothetical protein
LRKQRGEPALSRQRRRRRCPNSQRGPSATRAATAAVAGGLWRR